MNSHELSKQRLVEFMRPYDLQYQEGGLLMLSERQALCMVFDLLAQLGVLEAHRLTDLMTPERLRALVDENAELRRRNAQLLNLMKLHKIEIGECDERSSHTAIL